MSNAMNDTAHDTAHAVPRRPLGRTGFDASLLGIGDLADRSLPLATCVATLRRAIDIGLNLVDTAPGYEAGYSEEIVAQAVKGVRDQLFVIDKIDDLQAPVAPQIERTHCAGCSWTIPTPLSFTPFHRWRFSNGWQRQAAVLTSWQSASGRARPALAVSLHTIPTCCGLRSRPGCATLSCSRSARLWTSVTSPRRCRWRSSMAWARSASKRLGPANCWATRRATTSRCSCARAASCRRAAWPMRWRCCRG